MPTLSQIAAKSGEAKFKFKGLEFEIEFYADRVSKEFRAQAMRLQREIIKNEKIGEMLSQKVVTVVAADGSEEQVAEDAEAERAIQRLVDDDTEIKHAMDRTIASVMRKWTLEDDHGHMIPITKKVVTKSDGGADIISIEPSEELFMVPAAFEAACLTAILNDGQTEGEANGQGANSSTNTPLPLRPRDSRATLSPRPNYSRSSRRAR